MSEELDIDSQNGKNFNKAEMEVLGEDLEEDFKDQDQWGSKPQYTEKETLKSQIYPILKRMMVVLGY